MAVAAAVVACAALPAAACANGDPPSNTLETADVYVPADSAAPGRVRDLRDATRRANGAGYPVKVAVVGSAIELATLAQAFNRPQEYADYLAADLTRQRNITGGTAVLVVMPAGAGIAGKEFNDDERRAARTIDVTSGADPAELVGAATVTLERMAAAAGHPIGGGGSGGSGSSAALIGAIAGGLVALTGMAIAATQARRRQAPGTGPKPPG